MSPQIGDRAATFLIHPFKRARHVATWPRRRPRQRRTLLVSSRHEGRPHRSEKLGIFLDSRQSEAKFVANYLDSLAPKSLRGLVSDQLINPRFFLDWWLGVRWTYGSPPRSRGWEPGSCAAHGATFFGRAGRIAGRHHLNSRFRGWGIPPAGTVSTLLRPRRNYGVCIALAYHPL